MHCIVLNGGLHVRCQKKARMKEGDSKHNREISGQKKLYDSHIDAYILSCALLRFVVVMVL